MRLTMRIYFFTIIFLFDTFFGKAQSSKEEITKYHIYKVTENTFIDDSLSETTTTYYDKQGNVFKETWGRLEKNIENTYENNRLKKVVYYEFNGKEEQTIEYLYNPDGSYMTISTEKNFGLKNYEWYGTNGDIIKSFPLNGDTVFYKYNKQGKLESILSDANKKKTKIIMKCSYDTKGRLIKVQMQSDNFKGTEEHEYDVKGKLIKTSHRTIVFGNTNLSVTTYKYNEKGLLAKEITMESAERAKTTTTIILYEYEFYDN
jgi:hypothetical protein